MEIILPNKEKARSLATYALAIGALVKQPCEKCSSKKSEMHHVDYNKPREIMWLCRLHHRKWHSENPPVAGFNELRIIRVSRRTRKDLKVLCAEEGRTCDEMVSRLIAVYK